MHDSTTGKQDTHAREIGFKIQVPTEYVYAERGPPPGQPGGGPPDELLITTFGSASCSAIGSAVRIGCFKSVHSDIQRVASPHRPQNRRKGGKSQHSLAKAAFGA